MRLWSVHPKHLDRIGLVALWREALLAQAVLRGRTRGYRHHPQLERFRRHPQPRRAIVEYLRAVWDEADRRGYSFDRRKLSPVRQVDRIAVAAGQVEYEFRLLRQKVRRRDADWYRRMLAGRIFPHPLFRVVPGGVAGWERARHAGGAVGPSAACRCRLSPSSASPTAVTSPAAAVTRTPCTPQDKGRCRRRTSATSRRRCFPVHQRRLD